MSEEKVYAVKVGEKEIVIDEEVLNVLREYVHREMSLEDLAKELGLSDWREGYEFIRNVPAWILWVQPTLWKTIKTMKKVSEEVSRRAH
ncbi:MAG: hypothetical protein F7B60_03510 [Desulfurococcales archaeon]|nr:hypothetical protein [Desulfurococcales archaeon]